MKDLFVVTLATVGVYLIVKNVKKSSGSKVVTTQPKVQIDYSDAVVPKSEIESSPVVVWQPSVSLNDSFDVVSWVNE